MISTGIFNDFGKVATEVDTNYGRSQHGSNSPLRVKGSRPPSQSSLARLSASGLAQSVNMSVPLRKPKMDNRATLDSVRERYTYNLGDGNYLVLEEVDSEVGRRKDSNAFYIRGRGASNDKSVMVIDDLRQRPEAEEERARAL